MELLRNLFESNLSGIMQRSRKFRSCNVYDTFVGLSWEVHAAINRHEMVMGYETLIPPWHVHVGLSTFVGLLHICHGTSMGLSWLHGATMASWDYSWNCNGTINGFMKLHRDNLGIFRRLARITMALPWGCHGTVVNYCGTLWYCLA